MNTKKIIGAVAVVFIAIIVSSTSFAETYRIELNASQSNIEATFEDRVALAHGFLTAGIGGMYDEDDYRIAHAKITLGDGVLLSGLSLNLGFKGILGNIEKDHKDSDVMAVGFLISGSYPIPEIVSPLPIDVSLAFSIAPDPLCFLDSNMYMDVRASLDFRVVKNAAIILGYRYVEVRFDDDHRDWEKSDGTFFIGCRLEF